MRYKSTESDYVDFPLSSVSHGDHYDITTLIQSKLLCRDWKITAIIGLGRTDNSTADFKHTKEILLEYSNCGIISTFPDFLRISKPTSVNTRNYIHHLVKARWISRWGVTISRSPIKKIPLSQAEPLNTSEKFAWLCFTAIST